MLGERLFPLIQAMHRDLAGKITGMLLEIDNSELIHMLESGESLRAKVGAFNLRLSLALFLSFLVRGRVTASVHFWLLLRCLGSDDIWQRC